MPVKFVKLKKFDEEEEEEEEIEEKGEEELLREIYQEIETENQTCDHGGNFQIRDTPFFQTTTNLKSNEVIPKISDIAQTVDLMVELSIRILKDGYEEAFDQFSSLTSELPSPSVPYFVTKLFKSVDNISVLYIRRMMDGASRQLMLNWTYELFSLTHVNMMFCAGVFVPVLCWQYVIAKTAEERSEVESVILVIFKIHKEMVKDNTLYTVVPGIKQSSVYHKVGGFMGVFSCRLRILILVRSRLFSFLFFSRIRGFCMGLVISRLLC